jgi:hypothetical protein
MPDGSVLVAGGDLNFGGELSTAELYDANSGTWSAAASLKTGRELHSATLLADGHLLVAAGTTRNGSALTSAELYDVGLGFHKIAQPKIATARFGNPAHWVQLNGSLFQGISQASGGTTQDSSTNYPLVQLRSLGNDQVSFLFSDPRHPWSDTSFTSLPPKGFVAGPALVTVFTNGIPSVAKYLVVPQ